MSGYEFLTASQKEFEQFPAINLKKTLQQVNSLFTPYIFVKNEGGGRMIWTSCCNRTEFWADLPRTATHAHVSVWWGKHNYEGTCPFCGRAVKIKETRYIRLRNSLTEYHPVMIVSQKGGNVYARGYWARKVYEGDYAPPPLFLERYAYKFTPGEVTEWSWGWYGGTHKREIHPGYSPSKAALIEKFYGTNNALVAYTVIGAESIDKSFLKYTGWREWLGDRKYHTSFMNFLCLASMYPRKVEMLIKSGMGQLVEDYVRGWKKNARIIDWAENDFLKAFGLSKQEWNEFKGSGASPHVIEYYKTLRKARLDISFEVLKTIDIETRDISQFVMLCKKRKINPEKLLRYLEKFTGTRCHGGYFGISQAFMLYRDYLDIAEYLQIDLREHNNFFPKNLELAHNEAATEQNVRLEIEAAEKEKKELAKYAESLNERRKKYNFEYGEHFIRIAETQAEIVHEGKTLEHCVGGYAGRHVQGSTTILFLRRTLTPDAALYTIEMHGNRLIQIHGFRNDRSGPDPRKVMEEMLDVWLDWLKRGSPRDKQGNPKLGNKKKETNAA